MINARALTRLLWVGILTITAPGVFAQGFFTVDEQIEDYLEILQYNTSYKQDALNRLQWSGITDVRLYDEIENQLLSGYLRTDLDKKDRGMLNHLARALAYSGKYKYWSTLSAVKNDAVIQRVRSHARKALVELDDYIAWNDLILDSDINVEGKYVQEANYMRMLDTDNIMVQRLAARGIFVDNQQDPDLLSLVAEKLEALYMRQGLNNEEQDAVAWLCKAIGQSYGREYKDLLSRVAADSPYPKARKYAKKYKP